MGTRADRRWRQSLASRYCYVVDAAHEEVVDAVYSSNWRAVEIQRLKVKTPTFHKYERNTVSVS